MAGTEESFCLPEEETHGKQTLASDQGQDLLSQG